jgi:hypothetical protein
MFGYHDNNADGERGSSRWRGWGRRMEIVDCGFFDCRLMAAARLEKSTRLRQDSGLPPPTAQRPGTRVWGQVKIPLSKCSPILNQKS